MQWSRTKYLIVGALLALSGCSLLLRPDSRPVDIRPDSGPDGDSDGDTDGDIDFDIDIDDAEAEDEPLIDRDLDGHVVWPPRDSDLPPEADVDGDDACVPDCDPRECGLDPACPTRSCGTCPGSVTCNPAGHCQRFASGSTCSSSEECESRLCYDGKIGRAHV